MDSTNFAKMSQIIDPYSRLMCSIVDSYPFDLHIDYIDRFTKMKILSLQTGGDEFFLLDSEYAFWNHLQIATAVAVLR
jgi:PhoPQ-activated pathogenicity-related protein